MTDLYYGCRVTVGGTEIAAAWDGSDTLVGIASVTVTAGRDTIYSEEAAASATIKLIDPAGVWSYSTRISGVIVAVELFNAVWYPDNPPTPMIRGRGNAVTVERAEVVNPRTHEAQSVWITTITVKDGIVDLEAIAAAGPGAGGTWPADLAQNRIEYIRGILGTASGLITGLAYANVGQVGILDASTSLADVIRWTYAADRPTYQPVHDPSDGSIRESYGLDAATVPGLKLAYDGDQVKAVPVSDQTTVIPAAQIKTPDGITPSAAVGDAIDLVHITYLDGTGTDQTYTARTARYDPAGLGTRSWSIKTALTGQTAAAALAAVAVAIADASNDVLKLPTLEHHPQFWTDIYVAQTQLWTWRIAAMSNPSDGYYFDGALTNSMPGMPVLHKIINRTGTFDADGWHFTFTVHPAARGSASTLTLGDLDPAGGAATLGECADPLTIGLLGNITKGLT